MKHTYQHIIAVTGFILLAFASCKKEKAAGHNALSPIVISSFEPQIGSGGTEVLISGSNFTSDTSQLSVTINGKKLKIIASNTNQMMVVVPKKVGTGPITVTIGTGNTTSAGVFNYQYTRTVSTLAGSGTAGFANGQGTDAMFDFSSQSWYRTKGIAVDDNLNIYVADVGNHCIRKIDTAGNVTTLAGNPQAGEGYADGKGAAARFSIPYDVAVDAQGNVYSVDPGNYDIRKISPDGTATTWAWANQEPWSVAVDKTTGYIYYCGLHNPGNIYQVTAQWTTNQVVSALNSPAGIAFDKTGNLYASISGDQVIEKFTAGTWQGSVIAGKLGVAGYLNGAATVAQFSNPFGIAVDNNNNIYVAGNGTGYSDNPDESIRFVQAGAFAVSTFAGSGTGGYADGIGGSALFSAPTGVAVDKNGTVYVLDKINNRIRKIVSE
ncbi:IPT/TIG domain-containing protein [Mucilaginibacter sp. BJC16-A38]|uniref:IPT/TIG domain-containing protein n=1 Tax=Mucilaginibacter phenanthrenivorans TaxID=1234842 RepID=UPI00215883BF|nr:IPT/TIG domain-containing protein [Mucilaginibacter phenanthrenivorans]MCR8557197.1 IPT/TIG domain-containing protein [Mucilaginibacter phenanthrenivorans]